MRDTIGRALVTLGKRIMRSDPPVTNVINVTYNANVEDFVRGMRRRRGDDVA